MSEEGCVFVSYAHADNLSDRREERWLDRVCEHLEATRLAYRASLWSDESLELGEDWHDKIESAMRAAKAAILLLSPAFLRSQYIRDCELPLLLHKAKAEGIPVIPILVRPCAFSEVAFKYPDPNVGPEVCVPSSLQAPNPGAALSGLSRHEQDELLSQVAVRLLQVVQPFRRQAATAPASPYRGLLAFQEKDSSRFFGRDRYVVRALDKLATKPFVVVTGGSGSGKSSLVYAGLFPQLRGTEHYTLIDVRPSATPFLALARALASHLTPTTDDLQAVEKVGRIARLIQHGQLFLILDQLTERTGRQTVLFVDQFEELYTLCSEEVRTRYLNALLPMATFRGSHATAVKVIGTLRADFYAQVLRHAVLTELLHDGDIKLGPMNREELSSAILGPVDGVGEFERGLVDRLLDDVGEEPGHLALLQFTLELLWERRDGDVMTHEAYHRIGKVAGAVANRAETEYRNLSREEKAAARRALLALVQVGREGRADSRQQVRRRDLTARGHEDDATTRRVLHALTDARLLVAGRDEEVGEPTVELAHEAVIANWPRLQVWLSENREFLLWRQRLKALCDEWQGGGEDALLLLKGTLLDEARLWSAKVAEELTPPEREYIDASIAQMERDSRIKPIVVLDLYFRATREALLDFQDQLPLGVVASAEPFDAGSKAMADVPWYRLTVTICPSDRAADALGTDGEMILEGGLLEELKTLLLRTRSSHASSSVLPPGGAGAAKPAPAESVADTHALDRLQELQMQGQTGSLLRSLEPELDNLEDPQERLDRALIVFDMKHLRGQYKEAAALIAQELALYSEEEHLRIPQLTKLLIRRIHHEMFFSPVDRLWSEMLDLRNRFPKERNPALYGEILCMLGGNLGTLHGCYEESKVLLREAIALGQEFGDDYLVCRSLRKLGDFLRHDADLEAAQSMLEEAWSVSERLSGNRQRIYLTGCKADLERQLGRFASAFGLFEETRAAAERAYAPGWVAHTLLGRAETAMCAGDADEAARLFASAALLYRKLDHQWGMVQAGLGECRLAKSNKRDGWREQCLALEARAKTLAYLRDARFALTLVSEEGFQPNCLMFL